MRLALGVAAIGLQTGLRVVDDFSCTGNVDGERVLTVDGISAKLGAALGNGRSSIVVPAGTNLEEADKALQAEGQAQRFVRQGATSLRHPGLWVCAFVGDLALKLARHEDYARDLSFASQYEVPSQLLDREYRVAGRMSGRGLSEMITAMQSPALRILTAGPGMGKSVIAGFLCRESQAAFLRGKISRLSLLLDARDAREDTLKANACSRFVVQFAAGAGPAAGKYAAGLFNVLWAIGAFCLIVDSCEVRHTSQWVDEAIGDLEGPASNRYLFIGRPTRIERHENRVIQLHLVTDIGSSMEFAFPDPDQQQTRESFARAFVSYERETGRQHPFLGFRHLVQLKECQPRELPSEGQALQQYLHGVIDPLCGAEAVWTWLASSALRALADAPWSEDVEDPPSEVPASAVAELARTGVLNAPTELRWGHRSYMECMAAIGLTLGKADLPSCLCGPNGRYHEPAAVQALELMDPRDAVRELPGVAASAAIPLGRRLSVCLRYYSGLPPGSDRRRRAARTVRRIVREYMPDARELEPFREVSTRHWRAACSFWLRQAPSGTLEDLLDYAAPALYDAADWLKLSSLMAALASAAKEAARDAKLEGWRRRRAGRIAALAQQHKASADKARDEWEDALDACERARELSARLARTEPCIYAASLVLMASASEDFLDVHKGRVYDRGYARRLCFAALRRTRDLDLDEATMRVRSAALIDLGVVLDDTGESARAKRLTVRLLEELSAAPEMWRREIGCCRNNLGVFLVDLGAADSDAERELQAAESQFRMLGDHQGVSYAIGNLAAQACMKSAVGCGSRDELLLWAEEAVARAKDEWHFTGEIWVELALTNTLGCIMLRQGRRDEALERFQEARLKASLDNYDVEHVAMATHNTEVARYQALGQSAPELINGLESARRTFEEIGNRLYASLSEWHLGQFMRGLGDASGDDLIARARKALAKMFPGSSADEVRQRYYVIPSLMPILHDRVVPCARH
jgi:hypothetical protein